MFGEMALDICFVSTCDGRESRTIIVDGRADGRMEEKAIPKNRGASDRSRIADNERAVISYYAHLGIRLRTAHDSLRTKPSLVIRDRTCLYAAREVI